MDEAPPRSRWAIGWAACDRQQLNDLYARIVDRVEVRMLRPATSGLGLLQIRDSVRNAGFHLGEFSLSTAAVTLVNSQGDTVDGGAAIMLDDENFVVQLAVFDAVLAHQWPGYEQLAALVREGSQRIRELAETRQRILKSTAVNFATLGEEI